MRTSLEDKLFLEYPEGFHELDEDERKSLTFLEEGPCLCLSDPGKHILISIGWKQHTRQEFAADNMKTFEDILGTVSFL